MVAPLVVLAVPAALVGFANVWGGVEHLLLGALPLETREALHELDFSWGIALGSTAVAASGIGFAWLFYGAHVLSAERVRVALRPVHFVLERKYFLDELYEDVIVRTVFYRGIAGALAWFDANVIDGLANGIGRGTALGSVGLRLLQTGQVQVYGAIAFLGIIIAGSLAFLLHPL